MSSVIAILPFDRSGDRERQQRTLDSLPPNTKYVTVEHDGEPAYAIDQAVRAIDDTNVLLLEQDCMFGPDSLPVLQELLWDADATYPSVGYLADGEFKLVDYADADPFCPGRLLLENYIGRVALVNREAFLAAGGLDPDSPDPWWSLWLALVRQGRRLKPVADAKCYVNRRLERFPDRDVRHRVVADREPLAATFYYQSTPATTYWRCLLPARYLPGAAVFNRPTLDEEKMEIPAHEGAAIFQFPGSARHHLAAMFLREQGHKTLVEVDDNYLFNWPNMRASGWGKKKDDAAHSSEGHRIICAEVDAVTVTTETLWKQYRKVNPRTFICPNQIDPADWAEPEKPEDGVFRIGWFASMSHAGDAKLVTPALEWASRQPGVEIVAMGVGHDRVISNSNRAWWKFPYTHIMWSNDMGVYRRLMGQLDVGVAPIVGTPWANCRSDLKALEYAMAGAVPVLSDVPPYKDWRHEQGCLKAKTPRDFKLAIQRLVANKDEAKQLAADARAHVLAERTVEANVWRWQEAIAA